MKEPYKDDMYKLPALMRRVSDTVLIALTTSILGTLIFCWYLWWYIPLGISVDALEKQTINLHKRITSLEKNLDTSSWVPQELEEVERVLAQKASVLTQEPETLTKLLSRIKNSGARLLSWKPGKQDKHEYFVVRSLAIELEGSYEQLAALLEEVACTELVLTKTSKGLHGRSVLELISKRDV